jgi:hypothetical protein
MGFIEGLLRTLTVIIGTIGLCVIVLSSLVKVLQAILEPSARIDGQSELNYILSLPIGALLGGTLTSALLLPEKAKAKVGIIFSMVGGLTVTLCLAIGFLSADSRGLSLQELLRTITSPWCLPPLVASSAILGRGIYLLGK